MAMYHHLCTRTATSCNRIYMTQSPLDNQKDRIQFEPLESVFRRRLLTGIGTASLVALGANFGGSTSSLLGMLPDGARSLRLDVIYPIGGYTRCLDANEGFEFVYPTTWVGDQTLLYREAEKIERSLDLPRLSNGDHGWKSVNEPVVAFGPAGVKWGAQC